MLEKGSEEDETTWAEASSPFGEGVPGAFWAH